MPTADDVATPELDALLAADPDALIAQHGPFLLTSSGVIPTGTPTFEEWSACLGWVQRIEKAAPFWVGDLIAFGEGKYGETYAQALDPDESNYGTVANQAYVAKAVPAERRRPGLSFGHHQEVAPLTPDQQVEWLDKAESEKLTRDELRHSIKVMKAEAAGTPIELWLLVCCKDASDQTTLADRMRAEGRAVKLTAHQPKES